MFRSNPLERPGLALTGPFRFGTSRAPQPANCCHETPDKLLDAQERRLESALDQVVEEILEAVRLAVEPLPFAGALWEGGSASFGKASSLGLGVAVTARARGSR